MSVIVKAESEENYFIKRAKLVEETDPYAAKAWILTAKSLSPNNFDVQFEVYKQEKADKNYAEAAKCFSYIMVTFQNQPPELRHEISQLTNALRAPDSAAKKEEDFYVEMFHHISFDVQNRILLSLKRDSDNSLDYCQFVLLLMKKFPQMAQIQLVNFKIHERSIKHSNILYQFFIASFVGSVSAQYVIICKSKELPENATI